MLETQVEFLYCALEAGFLLRGEAPSLFFLKSSDGFGETNPLNAKPTDVNVHLI